MTDGPFLALLRRDIALAFRAGSGAFLGVVFFLVVIVTLPLATETVSSWTISCPPTSTTRYPS